LIGGWSGWAVTILDREDAALCGRRTGLFCLAKEARCGELPIYGLVGGIGVGLTWLSEQTGVGVTTILKHYGRFIHSSQADDFEMSKIEAEKSPDSVQFGHHDGHRAANRMKNLSKYKGIVVSPTGFEPVLPT
jgi:hypothetical protein